MGSRRFQTSIPLSHNEATLAFRRPSDAQIARAVAGLSAKEGLQGIGERLFALLGSVGAPLQGFDVYVSVMETANFEKAISIGQPSSGFPDGGFEQELRSLAYKLAHEQGQGFGLSFEQRFSALTWPVFLGGKLIGLCVLRTQLNDVLHLQVLAPIAAEMLAFFMPHIAGVLSNQRCERWQESLVETVVGALEAKDTYTHSHSASVAKYTVSIGRVLGLSEDTLRRLMFSALIHDIGKIGIPDQILKKSTLLSTEEFEIMRTHPAIGTNMLAHVPLGSEILAGVTSHHERWDGTGYPLGLSGMQIPLFARVIAVADAFDAMTSGRSYSGFVASEEAVEQLRMKTDLFDPDMLVALYQAFTTGELSIRTGTAFQQVDLDHTQVKIKRKL